MAERIRHIFLTLLFLSLFGAKSQAQNEGNVSMYWVVPTQFNPAMAGRDSAMVVSAMQRMQWVGMDDAPKTTFLSADMPFKFRRHRHGVGMSLLNDKAGLFATTIVAGQYNYSQKLWGGRFAAGLQVGMVNKNFNGGEIHLPEGEEWDATDESLPRTDVSGRSIDLGAGIYYEHNVGKGLVYGALSVQHFNESELDLGEFSYFKQKSSYYFLSGGNIPVSYTLLLLQPSLLIKTTGHRTQADVTLRVTYDRRFWGGLSYRTGDAVVVIAGTEIRSIRLSYAYDIGTSALAKASNGSHELTASYNIKMNLDKKKRHPHKSIRIL